MKREDKMRVLMRVSMSAYEALHRLRANLNAVLLLLLLLFLMLSCPVPGAESRGIAEAYRFAPGDRITINVFGHTDLSGDFLVDGAGNVSLPLVGGISISGLTVQESEEEIVRRLSDGYVRQPAVSVRINELRPIYVVGDVKMPGSYPYRYGASVLSAIALAGGVAVLEQMQGTSISDFLLADERLRILESTRRALIIRRARLEAQRDGARTFEAPDLLAAQKGDDQIASVVASERELLDVQMQVLNKEVDLLRQQKPRLKAAIEAVQGQILAERKQLELIQTRVREYKTLQGKGLGVISIGIELEREQARNEGNLSRFEAEIWRLELGLGEIDIKIQDAYNLFTRRVMGELQEMRAKLQEIEATLLTAREIRDLKLQHTGGVAGTDVERPRLSIAIVRSRGKEATTLNATEATLLEPGDVVDVRRILPRQQKLPIARSEAGNDPTRDSHSAAASSTNVVSRSNGLAR
jgi:polysaccharide export outer membrane protein